MLRPAEADVNASGAESEATARSRDELRISGEDAGTRLDRALAPLVDEGLRGRRRRIALGGVLVNGTPCRDPARRLRRGDLLALAPPKAEPSAPDAAAPARLLARRGDFCVLFKPAGLHSAALAGKDQDSLEARLPALCGPILAPGETPTLLQRLDQGTSGLVCAALTPEAARAFRAAEAAGRCEKRYLALLVGALPGPLTARGRLDTNRRRTSRLLAEDGDSLRWTEIFPLHVWKPDETPRLRAALRDRPDSPGLAEQPVALTLAACRIRCGARHQIRAHAAALGHPLLGDTRYAMRGAAEERPARFHLHHGCLTWPGAWCAAPPPWPWLEEFLPAMALARAREWLRLESLAKPQPPGGEP